MAKFRLPRKIVLPFGFIVSVQLVPPSHDKLTDDGAPADGLWDVDTKTIYINKKCGMKRRRYLVAHECTHMINDWLHYLLDVDLAKP